MELDKVTFNVLKEILKSVKLIYCHTITEVIKIIKSFIRIVVLSTRRAQSNTGMASLPGNTYNAPYLGG